MSLQAARVLQQKSQDLVPRLFEEVVGCERVGLLEVTSEADSSLAKTFHTRTGRSDSASTCALWCGHDLSTSEGLAVIVEQIKTLRPRHTWISPPCSAFSPFQNINQRCPSQIQDLKAKRAHATRILENVIEVVKVCIQLGCHVTVEVSERNEAWRLPIMQELRFHMGLHTCVVKGCAVGLRGEDGQLLQKGWRLVTSHARLADRMHKPCRCVTSYRHAKCEGRNAKGLGRYPSEFSRLVFEALSKEGDFQGIVQECSGESCLHSEFGLGLRCTCKERHAQGECGSCVVQRRETEERGEAYMNQLQAQTLETKAKHNRQQINARTLNHLRELLEQYPLQGTGKSRRDLEKPGDYMVFGSYAFGNHYGITNRSVMLPELCRYINQTLKELMPKNLQWSSFVLNHGSCLPVHRDYNNDDQHPNASVGFGSFEGGGLWVEDVDGVIGDEGKSLIRTNAKGESVQGREYNIQMRPLVFPPKAWHGSCPWKGDRWVLTVFVSRGFHHLSSEEVENLKHLGFPVPKPHHNACPAEAVTQSHKAKDPDEAIRKQLYLLHCATGHSHPKHMLQALKRRGVDERTLRLAEIFQCPVCQEKRKPQSRNLAALEPLPPKLATISADVGHWVHPHSEESINFMLVIDEGSRFRTARALTRGARQAPNAQTCLHYLQEGWVQYFKHPRCLRLDPAGAFRSQAVEDWCDKHGIFLDVVPGEAHWKVGTCENAVGGVKEVMSKLCQYDEHLSAEEALSEAVAVFNHKELVRGFSPAQHLLGQAPDETGRFLAACNQLPPGLLCENADGEFARSVKLRAEAEKAQCEWSAKQRILRAKHSRHRPCYNYQPGELVFYWRCQDSKKGRRQPGGKHGRFLGPARILATESRKDEAGQIRPGGAVWLVKGRSLLKCSPEQLRRASQREELLEALAGPHEQEAPWTFHTVAEQIGGNRYEDISNEKPDDAEWNRAQCPDEEVQPTRYRLRTKRPVATTTPDDVEVEPEPTDLGGEASASRQRSRSRGRRSGPNEGVPEQLVATAWWNDIKEQDWPEAQSSYWADTQAAIEIAIPLPDSKRGADRAWRDLGAYFVGSMRRRAVELSERRMSAAELEAFKGAKAIEVKNFVASKAFEVLPPHMRPDRQQAIGMRWILTWKLKEDGSRKAKARAVLLGYQDGSYEHRKTTSPVMTRQTRQLLLQMAAWRRWQVQKGDVTGAFLQSRTYPDQLYCIPCPEICQALGIEPGSITRVKRACYGLVDAPLEWYRSVDSFMKQIGFERLWSDSCCWVLRENGALRGMVSGHVDDFLFAGKTGDTLWESKLQAIREQFKWGDWESGKFTQCGVLVEATSSGFELSQPQYLDNLHEIGVNASRRRQKDEPTNERERTQLRALLGGLSWHAQQVAPYLAAEIGLLLTEVTRSTVDTMIRANILLAQAKAKQGYKMQIHGHDPNSEVMFVAWVDAANGNRVDGGSTQGIFVGATATRIMEGDICDVSPVSWASQKIDRSCRSPGASEAQAAVNGEDTLYSIRFQWGEMLNGVPDLHRPDSVVRAVKGCVVTDSRNVYDKLETEVLVVKGAEKRTSIEMLAVKESQICTEVQMRWVHSEAQLANTLTKAGATREYDLFYKMGHRWRLVEDPTMMSARRRKQMGLQPLEQADKKSKVKGVSDLESDQLQPEPTEL